MRVEKRKQLDFSKTKFWEVSQFLNVLVLSSSFLRLRLGKNGLVSGKNGLNHKK